MFSNKKELVSLSKSLIFESWSETHQAIVEIWDLFHLLCPMRTFLPSESCKEAQLNALNPQSWLQVERGKLALNSNRFWCIKVGPKKLYNYSLSYTLRSLEIIYFIFKIITVIHFWNIINHVSIKTWLLDFKLLKRTGWTFNYSAFSAVNKTCSISLLFFLICFFKQDCTQFFFPT